MTQKPGTFRISPFCPPELAAAIRKAIGGAIPEDLDRDADQSERERGGANPLPPRLNPGVA